MPFHVVITGSPQLASSGRAASAASRDTPPPSRSMGRRASLSSWRTASASASLARGSSTGGATGRASSSPRSTGAPWTSRQNSRNTGPHRGVRPSSTSSVKSARSIGASSVTDALHSGAATSRPSISWIPRWRTAPRARSVLLTWPPSTRSSRLSSHAPPIAVITFVRPGPAVTSVKARPLPPDALKYSLAMPAATSWTKGTHFMRLRTPSSRCMMFPPATKKQCV